MKPSFAGNLVHIRERFNSLSQQCGYQEMPRAGPEDIEYRSWSGNTVWIGVADRVAIEQSPVWSAGLIKDGAEYGIRMDFLAQEYFAVVEKDKVNEIRFELATSAVDWLFSHAL
jgi:hypothetical protein